MYVCVHICVSAYKCMSHRSQRCWIPLELKSLGVGAEIYTRVLWKKQYMLLTPAPSLQSQLILVRTMNTTEFKETKRKWEKICKDCGILAKHAIRPWFDSQNQQTKPNQPIRYHMSKYIMF